MLFFFLQIWAHLCRALRITDRAVRGFASLGASHAFGPLPSLALLLWPFAIQAQYKYDYNWTLGYNIISPPTNGGALLTFTQDSLFVEPSESGMWQNAAGNTMSDADGNLQYITNLCRVINADFDVIAGGDSINPGIIHDNNCNLWYPLTSQSSLSLPSALSPDKYFLFHLKNDYVEGAGTQTTEFLQSTIDMSLNDGAGEVTIANHQILEHHFASGTITAVKHSDGQSWWIIVPEHNTPNYVTWLLSNDTLSMPFIQTIGDTVNGGGGQAKFTPNGTKYARYEGQFQEGVQIFDFDRSTGLFSNPQELIWDDTLLWSGLEFSASGRYLYLTNIWWVYQFDTEADDIAASQTEVAYWDGFIDPNSFAVNFWYCQRGPDCRIYITTTSSTPYLSVIMQPDQPGLACDVRQHSVLLPALNWWTIPYHPNYRLDTEYPTCDTSIALTITALRPPPPQQLAIEAWPNPATSHTTIQGHIPPHVREVSVRVFNAQGQQVGAWQVATSGDTLQLTIDVSSWPSGVYTYQVLGSEGGFGAGGRVVVAR